MILNRSDYRRSKFKPLSPELEKKLTIESFNGNIESSNKLITHNLPLVISIALKYNNLGVDISELICEGNMGLITAATRFDPKFNNKFSTYAYFWVRQNIISRIKTNSVWNPQSNGNMFNHENYIETAELSVDMNEFDSEVDRERIQEINSELNDFPKRERDILRHYYGINGYEELNTIELGKKYDLSTMRISNIIDTTIRKIRCNLVNKL